MATHVGCFARIAELEAMVLYAKQKLDEIIKSGGNVDIAEEALEKLANFSGIEGEHA
jgi:hypothetical protein